MAAGHEHTTSNARLIAIALALTGTFLVAEVVGGILTGSLALISDASHMFTDTVGLAIALAAIRIGQRPADTRRTFGYQRFEILAAAANAILLFGVAAYILWEGYQRLIRPQEIQSLAMLGVATLGLIVNIIAMRLLSDRKDASLNVKGAYLEVWSDFLGSIGVILAALVIWITGWKWVDPVIAIGIGLWVLPRTWTLLGETINILLEGVPDGMDYDAIAAALTSLPAIQSLHDLHVWALSSDTPSLSAHLVVGTGTDYESVRKEATAVLAQQFKIEHATLQIEATDCRKAGAESASH
jgi:cobalt-zinc-cadmium efflux system protein